MNHRPGVKPNAPIPIVTIFLLLLALAAATLAACSGGSTSSSSTTTDSGLTTTSQNSSTAGTSTTSPPVTLSEYDRELAKTATVQHDLVVYLDEQQAADDDPRYGIVYGLRARTQAITGRQALAKNDFNLADVAMRDIYSTLNLGKRIATGTTAQTLEDAHAIVETLGAPSDAPDRAATLLDEFIAALSPLLDEATATVPSTGTT